MIHPFNPYRGLGLLVAQHRKYSLRVSRRDLTFWCLCPLYHAWLLPSENDRKRSKLEPSTRLIGHTVRITEKFTNCFTETTERKSDRVLRNPNICLTRSIIDYDSIWQIWLDNEVSSCCEGLIILFLNGRLSLSKSHIWMFKQNYRAWYHFLRHIDPLEPLGPNVTVSIPCGEYQSLVYRIIRIFQIKQAHFKIMKRVLFPVVMTMFSSGIHFYTVFVVYQDLSFLLN